MIQLNSQLTGKLLKFFKLSLRCLPVYLATEALGRVIEASFEPALARFGDSSGSFDDSLLPMAVFVGISTAWNLASGAIRLVLLRDFLTIPGSRLSRASRINLLMIESTRAMASAMFRIPLFAFPAIVQWIRLAPLPYLVLLSPRYESGQVDALKLAADFAGRQKLMTLTIAAVPIVILILELLLASDPASASDILTTPLQHIGSIFEMSTIKLTFDACLMTLISRKLTET